MRVSRRAWAWGAGAALTAALALWAPVARALPLLGLVALGRALLAAAALWLAPALPRRLLPGVRRRAVLITGCDSGFGHSAALRLHALGAPVFAGVLAPDGAGAQQLRDAAAADAHAPRLRVLPMDVTDDASVRAALDAVADELRRSHWDLWAVVNNAGIINVGEAEWTEIADIKKIFDVNVLGQVRVTKYFLPLLKLSKGRVINLNSLASTIVAPTLTAYTMSKFASLAYTTSLSLDMQKFSVSVHSIEPSMYRTSMVESTLQLCKEKVKQIPEEVRNTYCENYEEKFLKLHYIVLHLTAMPKSRVYQVADAIEDACFAEDPQVHYHPGEGSKLTKVFKDIIPALGTIIQRILYK